MPRVTIDRLHLKLPRNADAATVERAVARALGADARLSAAPRTPALGAAVGRQVAGRVRAELAGKRR